MRLYILSEVEALSASVRERAEFQRDNPEIVAAERTAARKAAATALVSRSVQSLQVAAAAPLAPADWSATGHVLSDVPTVVWEVIMSPGR
jgi:IS5 family transposase